MGRPRKRQRQDNVAENYPSTELVGENPFGINLEDQPLPSFDEWTMPSFDVSRWETSDFSHDAATSAYNFGVSDMADVAGLETANSGDMHYSLVGSNQVPAASCNGSASHASPPLLVCRVSTVSYMNSLDQ